MHHRLGARSLVMSPECLSRPGTLPPQFPPGWPQGTRRRELNLLPASGFREVSGQPVVHLQIHDQLSAWLIAVVAHIVTLREIHVVEVSWHHFDLLATDEERDAIVGDYRHVEPDLFEGQTANFRTGIE